LHPSFTIRHRAAHFYKNEASMPAVLGKHPDLSVGPPTATVFLTNDRKYKKSQFFEKIFKTI
jgi:hypothetical protein